MMDVPGHIPGPERSGIRLMAFQFTGYLLSGGAAAILALAAYAAMVWADVWYVSASVLSDVVGLILVFVFNKFLVFRKKENFVPHAARYIGVQVLNSVIQVCAIYILVEYFQSDKILARVLSIGVTVPMNFLLYKYYVYI